MDFFDIAQFVVATLMPVGATAFLTSLRNHNLKEMPDIQWQILCGIFFGAIAIYGTEFGIDVYGATMNVRDAAPLVAGMFFGGPAGIIAGIIGGVERWFAALWGRGMFTRLACSVATCFAGFYAAFLRRFAFEGHRPRWTLALVTGIVAEVLHMLLIFLLNSDQIFHALLVVLVCSGPMIACTAVSATLSAFVCAFVEGRDPLGRSALPHIAQIVQRRLLSAMVLSFLVAIGFTMAIESHRAEGEMSHELEIALDDVESDIKLTSDNNLLSIATLVAKAIPVADEVDQETLDSLKETYDVTEIHVVDESGIIVASTNEKYVGYDMRSGAQSEEFLSLLPGGDSLRMVQEFRPMAYDESVWRKYAGVSVMGGFVQVGYDSDKFLDDISEHAATTVIFRHIGSSGGFALITPGDQCIGVCYDIPLYEDDGSVKDLSLEASVHEPNEKFSFSLNGENYIVSYRDVEGIRVYAFQSVDEVTSSRNIGFLLSIFMFLMLFALVFIVVYQAIRSTVVKNIWSVNDTLGTITEGDLDALVDVRDSVEFESLSNGINATVDSLKDAISAEAARIEGDLAIAKAIQESALPSTFPPFPEVLEFDIYASMNPAREVGGDFYDFFLINDTTLGFLVADVAGKGIPASLFMMAAKTELANYMSSGMGLADAVQTVNWHLCNSNDADMFVTVWAATLDWNTGLLTYVNAGHNPPLLRRDGSWQWLKTRGGLFLGSYEGAKYHASTITLESFDELFLYTDGVNEAFNTESEEYGNARLEAFLTSHARMHPHALIDAVSEDLARWSEGAEQSDDITMLALEFGVAPEVSGSIIVPATINHLEEILGLIHAELANRFCPISVRNQIDIVIEEIFVNVCSYAYQDQEEPGNCRVDYLYNANPNAITVGFIDWGVPFDPLQRADPTKPENVMDAQIGGLGIYMVKRMTDDLSYVREGDMNILIFQKRW